MPWRSWRENHLMKIAIIGAGISGIRAALSLGRAGHDVTLFEKQKFLGGRAFSFITPELGEIDIGQHVWLKCCTALEALIRDLAIPDELVCRQESFAINYKRPDRDDYLLRSMPLPGLLHLLPGLLRFPGLKMGETIALLRGMARAKFMSGAALEKLDAVSFAKWLDDQGQSAAAVAAMWEPLALSVCNQRPGEVSARHALFTFRKSLLHSKHAADICMFRAPLSDIFDRRAQTALRGVGVKLRMSEAVQGIVPGASVEIITAVAHTAEIFDRALLTVPVPSLAELLPEEIKAPAEPGRCAVAGLLIQYPQVVMDDLFFAALDSPVQWVFNKSAIWNRPASGGSQLIEIVISGAEKECSAGADEVQKELLPALAELLPRTRGLEPAAIRFVSHAAATFAVPPGAEPQRHLINRPLAENIYLAGDQAATGWPSTMESAARAGEAAAAAIIRSDL